MSCKGERLFLFFIVVLVFFSSSSLGAAELGEILQRTKGKTFKKTIKKGKKYDFSLSYSGNLSLENFYDSRQVRGSFQDQFVRYPFPVVLDNRNLDINDKDQFGMLGIKVYGILDILGPEIWGAKTSAKVEGKFTGVSDETIRLLRLNKAFAQFDWENTTLLLGHNHHPICRYIFPSGDIFYPFTLSSSWGRGYDPFQYVAQARLAHRIRNFEFLFAATKHYREQTSRWATRPDLFVQVSVESNGHIFSIGLDNHVEIPRLRTFQDTPTFFEIPVVTKEYKTTEQISSIHAFFSALLKFERFQVQTRVLYSENGKIFDLIGAYAVKCYNTDTDESILTNLRAVNFWIDFVYKGSRKFEPGLFVGLTKNIGAHCNIIKSATLTGDNVPVDFERNLLDLDGALTNVDNMFVIAPRLRVRFGPMMIGGEIEYVRTAFARTLPNEPGWQDDFDCRGRVIRTCPVSNTRFLLATRYFF